MKNKYRVLLLDDTREVLELLQATLEQDIQVESFLVKVEVVTLHVTLEALPGGTDYQITAETLKNLGDLCGEGFDFIFSDFSFIGDSHRNEELRATLLREKRGVEQNDIRGFVLHLKDIQSKFERMRDNDELQYEIRELINRNFIHHSGRILIYTNSPAPFNNYFDTRQMPIRKNEVRGVFKDARSVEFFMMHDEFSITPELEHALGDSTRRKTYFSALLSKRIESLIKEAVLKDMVSAQSKLRFRNTKKAFQRLTAIGIGFGALVALFGEVIYHLLHKVSHLTTERLHLNFDSGRSILINILILAFVVLLSWLIFPAIGVKIAKKTEQEVDNLL
jgi:hypothetical protein